MVAVAQLVESRIVIPVVVGSSPIGHPSFSSARIETPCSVLLVLRRPEQDLARFRIVLSGRRGLNVGENF